ncbi:MAG: ATP-binding protein [Candidatus Cloacimonadaceae bacterium]
MKIYGWDYLQSRYASCVSYSKTLPCKKCHQEPDFKRDFLGNVSHEMRTPMNAIMGFAQMLQGTNLDATQAEYVDVIYQSAKNLLGLISGLLDIASLHEGKMDLNPVNFDPELFINRLWASYRPQGEAKNLIMSLEKPPHLPPLKGDMEKIARVLGFLLSNALKFTEKGYIRLKMELERIEDDQGVLCFEVEDSGCGIEAEYLAKIFDLFEMVDSSYSRKYQGLGLGLSLTTRLVEILDGSLGAASTPDKGSCFYFQVPVLVI